MLYVCAYIYIYIHVHVYLHAYIYIHIYIYIHTCRERERAWMRIRSGVAQWLVCWAHTPKVPGSKPGFAMLC